MDRGEVLLVVTPFLWTVGEDAGMATVYRTLTGFRDNGFDVHVVLPDDRGRDDWAYRGLEIHSFRPPAFGLRGRFGLERSSMLLSSPARLSSARWKAFLTAMTLSAVARSREVARRHHPTIVYGIAPVGALAAAAVGRLVRAPNVTRLFGTHLARVHGLALAGHLWELAAFRIPADLLVVTDDGTLGDVVAKRLGADGDRFRFLMNGVDDVFLTPYDGPSPDVVRAGLGLGPGTHLFVFAHHLLPDHNAEALLAAVARLVDERLDVAVVVAGDGPEGARLRRWVAERGLGGRLILAGDVSRSRIRELMAAADAVVSLDSLSNVVNSVLEALAMGRPVIASDSGGTRGLLTDEVDSLIVPGPAPATDEVARALRRVVLDGELLRRLSAGARATSARRLVSWNERAKREGEMLRELVDRAG